MTVQAHAGYREYTVKIEDPDKRHLAEGACDKINDADMRWMCKGQCWKINDRDTRNLCIGMGGMTKEDIEP